ncbi:tRNA (adenosine(37)-N6)-threonylcarbamoyltransferase complex ATPase subunit type 1 TsaE [uncultured Tateyamaria sp.]|uniref:tRNA (adenosine(37)-N6)-threonylcarbamoyltransferase complex ATPase subunit type 1 TsaE n=1 Tax=Tateyamaria sp. 1078 TaxID=3417464 RepID=UPI002604C2C5|nr:tRNA (adenosine(37)-N6)-threonylcarbamoyltransferase complex ATPase subunit type 1 TsaE [uncultured Tateyamaria sp.]
MLSSPFELDLPDADATAALGVAFGHILRPGDTLLLDGPVGAGKTHFARALIQSILSEPEDVPSPTFTLVQVYDTTRGTLWHTDLYRLSDSSEIEELGLTEAFETAICLVEWPDRLGTPPAQALLLRFADAGDGRKVTMEWQAGDWADRVQVGLNDV